MIQHKPDETEALGDKNQRAASITLYGFLVLLALWVMRDFIPAVVWAGVIAIALWPLLLRLETPRASHLRTIGVALLLTTAVALFVVLPFLLVITQAVHESHEFIAWFKQAEANGLPLPALISHLPFGAQQVTAWWQENLARPLHDSPFLKGLHVEAAVITARHVGALAVHGLILFGFMLMSLFVIFLAGSRMSGNLVKITYRGFGVSGALLAHQMTAAVRGTVAGLVVVGIGEGVLLGIAYAIAGVPHATLLGLLTAIAAMLPFCAPIIFCGTALWLLAQGATVSAISVAVFGFAVVLIAEHLVRPLLIGNSTRLPFLLVLFGILGGAQTFGLLGLFIGPALMTVLTVLWRDWVVQD
ncbi:MULTISPECIES: AI-2E family transporter [unclassified Herbaspirillum]|uniref:AI-2E family transporter n=1 Tax=unclassified Herbaspirillum TaxID=2624150 RepID=UPI000E2F5250|nr:MULTISPECIES: AI-2E family transporter [unclassified Herbaspirillum]RFB67992.1 AI-2E family transporter [Herbaspirillum sp. 3R-3a1]TFI06433.1 AI-2E family transporter [Herbaspirillum sp. 3R11]TFI13955.1 AI-2E family transporter [Herbaspirillum sp. 3R-11]TFI29853.1 AI-2E family transporter [Herbaspirillum sp. 3C11]